MGKTPQELYRDREKRIEDAIQLKIPDRVPFTFALILACFSSGTTQSKSPEGPAK